MEDQKPKDPWLALSGVLALVVALGAMVYSLPPLKGTRPSVPEMQDNPPQVRARLWQDPFCAVLDHAKAQDKGEPITGDSCDLNNPKKTDLRKLKKGIESRLKNGKAVTVLGVMVFGEPYAEDMEKRIRRRYAVLRGLGRLDFAPEDSEHIDFFRIYSAAADTPKSKIVLSNIVPYEWLERGLDRDKEFVLLLWINDDLFRRSKKPLASLARLFSNLSPQKKNTNLKFKVIGPAGSTTLFDMITEPKDDKSPSLPFEIYSALATDLDSFRRHQINQSIFNPKYLEDIFAETFKSREITFYQTICSDRKLVKALIDELERRGVDVLCKKGGSKQDQVVLVSEWDTTYGRSLPKTFVDVLREEPDLYQEGKGKKGNLPEGRQNVNWVESFSYLRGLDGKLPGEQERNAKDRQKSDGDRKEEGLQSAEDPTGKSQYDYLRRLADHIYELDQDLQRKGQGSIQAIGVLGSDFYDKYLVLQALGQRFQNIVFFTTDLDARLLYSANNKWTRNLVVASGFGLELHKELQGDVPPFRDVYQTSVFFATLRAFSDRNYSVLKKEDIKQTLEPRIFEIGRSQAIDLTADTNERKSDAVAWEKGGRVGVHPRRHMPRLNSIHQEYIQLFLLILSITLFFLYLSSTVVKNMLNGFGRFISKNPYIILIGLSMIWLLWVSMHHFDKTILNNRNEEPFLWTWFEGASAWPTEILRLFAIVLSWTFIFISSVGVRKNTDNLVQKFRLTCRAEAETLSVSSPGTWEVEKGVWKRFLEMASYDWEVKKTTEGGIGMSDLWEEYLRRGAWRYRIRRAILFLIVLLPLALWVNDQLISPVRGNYSRWIDIAIRDLAEFSILILTFYVFDVTRLCRHFVNLIWSDETRWPQWSPESVAQFSPKVDQAGEDLKDWMYVRLIAERTDVVGKLIFYPFVVLVVTLLARSHLFENWWTPTVLVGLIFGLSLIYTWSCALTLRRAAEKMRRQIVDNLSKKLIAVIMDNPKQKSVEQINFVLNEVKAVQSGAFAPFLQQPVMQTLLVPFVGLGGSHLLDFFSK